MTESVEMSRTDAIDLLARSKTLSEAERRRVLEASAVEFYWEEEPDLDAIVASLDAQGGAEEDETIRTAHQAGVLSEFVRGEFTDVMGSRWDTLVADHLKYNFKYLKNDLILEELKSNGVKVDKITGEVDGFACPCCGAVTLSERQGWEICPVCWWEDDGTDNADASLYFSGPNKGLQLTEARIFFLLTGIFHPNRQDLKEKALPIEQFERRRIFEIDKDRGVIFEKGTEWYAPLEPPHLKPGEKDPKVSLAGAGARDWPPTEN